MGGTGNLVYVVDDDLSAREGVAALIRSAGLMARTFASGEEFLGAPRPKVPSCLVLDLNLPGLNGLDLQEELAKTGVQIPIIFLTGYGDIRTTVRAVKAGAANFFTKPFDDEDLLNAIERCITCSMGHESECLQSEYMIGQSPEFKTILADIQVVAPTDAAVLIQGETGTGKELVARAIHDLSGRSQRTFIKVNCAAIPGTLLESELFGHEKGSFTGAFAQKIGRFEAAHQGTLFLDEIGEMPLELQPKLLRALQEQELERLGGNRTINVDVRIIASTNRNLKQMVDDGKFRSDLYYRLFVFPVTVPPLRQRRQDIPLLIRFFTQKYARKMNRVVDEISPETLEALTSYDWPGNIRELQNLVERSVILSPGRVLRVAVPKMVADSRCTMSDSSGIMSRNSGGERDRMLEALRLSGGKVSGCGGAADRLGLRRTTLQSRMRKLGIEREFR